MVKWLASFLLPQNNKEIQYPDVQYIYNCFKSSRRLKMKYNVTQGQLHTL